MGALWFFFWTVGDWAAPAADPLLGQLALVGVGKAIAYAFVVYQLLSML